MLRYSRSGLVDGRVEEATLPRLVSIYSGFPRFPRLCHARSASPVCIILYLFRLVTSYTRSRPASSSSLYLSPPSSASCTRVGSDGRKLRLVPCFRTNSVIYASLKWLYGLYRLQENPRRRSSFRHLFSHLSSPARCNIS